ncbi:MAG TPA: SgcJ/EcaC family oxidoreductase [Candidatus Polarisedimenticolia bacterium]|jgi:uncharacterized protein (TIGR02246 family)|nr:SgcJ/EcaC family oxidoreductase [Candidatus Polarisedimenticolia bacterium]
MSIEHAIRRVVEELVEAWNRGDGPSFSRLFAENADYVTASGVRLAGRGRIRDALFTRPPASAESGRVSLVTESVKMLGPDAAVILCAWHMDPGHAPEIRESSVRTGFVTLVMQGEADGWRIIALQNTDTTS